MGGWFPVQVWAGGRSRGAGGRSPGAGGRRSEMPVVEQCAQYGGWEEDEIAVSMTKQKKKKIVLVMIEDEEEEDDGSSPTGGGSIVTNEVVENGE